MVDYEIDGHERLYHARIFSEARNRGTHRRKIDEQRNAGEILKQHTRNDERDLFDAFAVGLPVGELAHVVFGDLLAITIAQY